MTVWAVTGVGLLLLACGGRPRGSVDNAPPPAALTTAREPEARQVPTDAGAPEFVPFREYPAWPPASPNSNLRLRVWSPYAACMHPRQAERLGTPQGVEPTPAPPPVLPLAGARIDLVPKAGATISGTSDADGIVDLAVGRGTYCVNVAQPGAVSCRVKIDVTAHGIRELAPTGPQPIDPLFVRMVPSPSAPEHAAGYREILLEPYCAPMP